MKVNFSIPVTLFDYKQSENPLYSFAKLKIFYVGMTGDKRLFTKEFSDKLLETLPYVPVVGYYDEESEDFIGHNQKVQHIYGVVPEDTGVEYVKEDGKEYAVCDVILYTGRPDDSGEIAQKIVGKSHSLELDPKNTKYKIHRDQNGKFKHVEFKEGRLFGLSVLGENDRPAFSGSEFFNENLQLTQAFEVFKETLNEFVNEEKLRGERMDQDIVNESQHLQSNENFDDHAEETIVEGDQTNSSITSENDTNESLSFTKKEQFYIDFMRNTVDEIKESLQDQLSEKFGSLYIVQWSMTENLVVFVDFNDYEYYRVDYVMDEKTETLTFGEKIPVKMRFLTNEEISKIFSTSSDGTIIKDFESLEGESNCSAGEPEPVLPVEEQMNEDFSQNNSQDGGAIEQEIQQEEGSEEEQQESDTPTFSESEREELIALREEVREYRKVKKLDLIESFKDDLSSDFTTKLEKELDNYTFDEIEVILSKEFTKIMKSGNKKETTFTPFIYGEKPTTSTKTKKEQIEVLVEQYK